MAPSDPGMFEPPGDAAHGGPLQPRGGPSSSPFTNGGFEGNGHNWLVPSTGPTSGAPSQGAGTWLRALRRRWFLALFLGLIGGSAAGVTGWMLLKPSYTASSMLRVSSQMPKIMFDTAENDGMATGDAFEIYKRNQQALIGSRFVILRALRDPEVAKLPMLKDRVDPVLWLQNNIKVNFPGNAEIMQISLAGKDRAAITKIVNAVTDAYFVEVVEVENKKRRDELTKLREIRQTAEQNLLRIREQIKNLADTLGTKDGEVLTLKQQNDRQKISSYSQLVTELELSQMTNQMELERVRREIESNSTRPISPLEMEPAINEDPAVIQQFEEISKLEEHVKAIEEDASPTGKGAEIVARHRENLELARKALERRREEARASLEPRIREARLLHLQAQEDDLARKLEVTSAHLEKLRTQLADLERAADMFGSSSVEMDQMTSDVESLKEIKDQVVKEVESRTIELDADPRIEQLDKARAPIGTASQSTIVLSIFLGLVGFAVPVVGVTWLELRARRVHSTSDVTHAMGMRVIGSLPSMPRGALRRLGGRSRQTYWMGILRESVDGVRTMLIRQTELAPTQVVIVTSAVAAEGKTSLATQLALSFARAGRRTLLVDCDLRRPAAHQAFNLSLEPGVCDVLRGEVELADAVRPTDAKGLWMLTAGRSDGIAFAGLSRGKLGDPIEELKKQYEFIIIDCAPVLPVVDAMLVAQHADAAVLSVLSGVSQSPRIFAASERLSAMGVRLLGAVVAAVSEDVYFLDYKAHVEATAQPSLTESEV